MPKLFCKRLLKVLFLIKATRLCRSLAPLETSNWTIIRVTPPPLWCLSAWSTSSCDVLQNAIDAATSRTVIVASAGNYFPQNFGTAIGLIALIHHPASSVVGMSNSPVMSLSARDNLIIRGDAGAKVLFDGWSGVTIKSSSNISIEGFEMEGPAARISASEASNNRLRKTSRDPYGRQSGVCGMMECSSCASLESCESQAFCGWSASTLSCSPSTIPYYSNKGVTVADSDGVSVRNCTVHHAAGSGVRADRTDNMDITNCTVFDNIWWTSSGASAIVFAEALGRGINAIVGCVVFGNRNFLPFYTYDLSHVEGSVEARANYSQWNQDYVIDGSGVYLTRNQNYQGTFLLLDNVAYDNGINGVVVHKTNHDDVQVLVKRNIMYGRQTERASLPPFFFAPFHPESHESVHHHVHSLH